MAQLVVVDVADAGAAGKGVDVGVDGAPVEGVSVPTAKFSARFDAVFSAEGIGVIRAPVQAPRANAICERMAGTIRRECLDLMLVLGAGHLEKVLTRYLGHKRHRPHHSLHQQCPDGPPASHPPEAGCAPITRDVLGGLIHEYEWAAR